MIDHGSLTGAIGAYLTGVAVTSAPWLLTTTVLMTLRIVARSQGAGDFGLVERMLTVIYACTVVLSAPVHVVVSRYTADRLYERQAARIAAPLRRALAATLVGFAGVGLLMMLIMRVPLGLGLAGTVVTVVVGAQWLMLSVGGGMSSPLTVLRAFGFGAPLSLIASLILDRSFQLGTVGYLYGFGAGQLVTLVILMHGVARAIPPESDEAARLAPAFLEYKLLAVSSLAYYMSIWTDKVVVYVIVGKDAAALYAAVSALAWFSVIPAFGWIYVQIETAFYRRFRTFFDALEQGAPLHRLKQGADTVADEAKRILRGAGLVQAVVTAIALGGAPFLMRLAGLSAAAVLPFRLAVIGAALQVITLLEILLLYYFDLRRDALIVSMALFLTEIALTIFCWAVRWPPVVGYAAACGITCTAGLLLVRRRLGTLLVDTFQSQPFAGRL
jgi:uncharacterized membrane protein